MHTGFFVGKITEYYTGTGGKPATLATGAVVRVPLFVQTGEIVKVDTRSGEYASRAQK